MARITSAAAYANGSVALVCWHVDEGIPDCVGFTVVRVYENNVDDPSETRRVMPSWVPFKGQQNPDWLPQDTNVWPVQRLMWRDLTLMRRRDQALLRNTGSVVHYEITPVGFAQPGDTALTSDSPNTYVGTPRPLKAIGDTFPTNSLTVTSSFGGVRCGFTNGVLSTQFLLRVFEQNNETLNASTLRAHIEQAGDAVRTYLAGSSLPMITSFFEPAGATFLQALYELQDGELIAMVKGLQGRDRLVLSNTAKGETGPAGGKVTAWDVENQPVRDELHTSGFDITDRLFNNGHIGHNKFSVRVENGAPREVLTGSTNWTNTGLCAQSNNVIAITSDALAQQYADYWQDLKDDADAFGPPPNKQGTALRAANSQPPDEVTLGDGTVVQAWFSPNTPKAKSGSNVPTPPDLSDVFSRMRRAERLILFAVFQPSQSAKGDVVRQAIDLGADQDLLVYGCVSDKSAMPNFVPAPPKGTEDKRTVDEKDPLVFDQHNVHIVQASALTKDDTVGAFMAEMLKSSNMAHAIIHDKIVVVDPLSDNGFVVTGSHNLGVKASYDNDENLLVLSKNKGLALAYAVHILDLYDHYRFRAFQAWRARHGDHGSNWFDGFLETKDTWMDEWTDPARRDLAAYLATGA